MFHNLPFLITKTPNETWILRFASYSVSLVVIWISQWVRCSFVILCFPTVRRDVWTGNITPRNQRYSVQMQFFCDLWQSKRTFGAFTKSKSGRFVGSDRIKCNFQE